MGLVMADNIINYARNYRVVYLGGRYGGGKTAFAFRLAHELVTKYKYRYLLSNVASVWNTPAEAVQLRDGVYADAVMILDEGGMFLDNASEAKSWLAYLRKLNIILLVPSVLPPSTLMRRLSVQRTFNANSIGIPAWLYGLRLDAGIVKQEDKFLWWKPSEIFGIYDTVGMPADASELLAFLKVWTDQAKKQLGYQSRTPLLVADAAPAPILVPDFSALVDGNSELQAVMSDALVAMNESRLKRRR